MKKIFLFCLAAFISFSLAAQGNSGNKGKSKDNPSTSQADNPGNSGNKDKGKDKSTKEKNNRQQNEDKAKNDEHDRKIWDGVEGSKSCGKPSKNQPAKVREAFQGDYPTAVNVRWTKCRGDWTATFSGAVFRSTAVYHANGDRKDTRTPIGKNDLPGVILDSIFKRKPGINIGDIIRIELPGGLNDLFRIKTDTGTQSEFQFFNKLGEMIKYDY